jgi:hypothetical protein
LEATKKIDITDCVAGGAKSTGKDAEQTLHRADCFGILRGILPVC